MSKDNTKKAERTVLWSAEGIHSEDKKTLRLHLIAMKLDEKYFLKAVMRVLQFILERVRFTLATRGILLFVKSPVEKGGPQQPLRDSSIRVRFPSDPALAEILCIADSENTARRATTIVRKNLPDLRAFTRGVGLCVLEPQAITALFYHVANFDPGILARRIWCGFEDDPPPELNIWIAKGAPKEEKKKTL